MNSVHSFKGNTSGKVPLDGSLRRRAARNFPITTADLHRCLYASNEVTSISKEDLRTSLQKNEVKIYWCKVCHKERADVCPYHGPLESFEIKTSVDNNNNNNNNNNNKRKLSNALESFPNEVGLCKSSIPSAGYGVCAKQHIPNGTWIGPYEGDIIRPEEIPLGVDGSYLWEIFHEGKLLYYLDGRDEEKSSWMRFIRCARHIGEQNMYAFQYCGNIYYRTFKDIAAGTEMLVWYDEKYPQYMGIPLEIHETFASSAFDPRQQKKMVVMVPREPPPREPSYPYQPTPQSRTAETFPTGGAVRPSRDLPRAPENNMRQNMPRRHLGLRASHGREAYNTRNASRTYEQRPRAGYNVNRSAHSSGEDSGQGSQVGVPVAEKSVQWETNVRENTQTNGHHNHPTAVESTKVCAPLEVTEPSEEEEEDSSDGSDATGFFNCGQCGKSFAQRSVLQIHVCPNMPRKPYHCGHCAQSFDHPNELRTHAVIHAGEKPFKCGYCSRSFAGATTLNNHIRTHTGEKPFTCERCGKNFTQASQLHKHTRIPGDCIPYMPI